MGGDDCDAAPGESHPVLGAADDAEGSQSADEHEWPPGGTGLTPTIKDGCTGGHGREWPSPLGPIGPLGAAPRRAGRQQAASTSACVLMPIGRPARAPRPQRPVISVCSRNRPQPAVGEMRLGDDISSTPSPQPPHHPVATATATTADLVAARAALSRATGILMALIPCTADTARRILARAARGAHVTDSDMATAATALRSGQPVRPAAERALRQAIDQAQSPPSPAPEGTVRTLPSTFVLRQHLSHLRATRRRALLSPEDPDARAALDDAAYTLCVLTGQRAAYAALQAAEEHVAAHRLPPPAG